MKLIYLLPPISLIYFYKDGDLDRNSVMAMSILFILMLVPFFAAGAPVEGLMTVMIMFVVALNPLWAGKFEIFVDLSKHRASYVVMLISPLVFSALSAALFQYDLAAVECLSVLAVSDSGRVCLPIASHAVYILSSSLFAVVFLMQVRKGNRKNCKGGHC